MLLIQPPLLGIFVDLGVHGDPTRFNYPLKLVLNFHNPWFHFVCNESNTSLRLACSFGRSSTFVIAFLRRSYVWDNALLASSRKSEGLRLEGPDRHPGWIFKDLSTSYFCSPGAFLYFSSSVLDFCWIWAMRGIALVSTSIGGKERLIW